MKKKCPWKNLKNPRRVPMKKKCPVKIYLNSYPRNTKWCPWKKVRKYARETIKVPVKNKYIVILSYIVKPVFRCFFWHHVLAVRKFIFLLYGLMKSASTARTSITGRAKNLSLVPSTHKTPKSRSNVLNFQNFCPWKYETCPWKKWNLCPWKLFCSPWKKPKNYQKVPVKNESGREKGENLAKKWAWKTVFAREK